MNTFEFTPITAASEADFLPFWECSCFGDITFRALYAWQPEFGYKYIRGEDYLLVSDTSVPWPRSGILMKKPDADLTRILDELMQAADGPIALEFIPEEALSSYEASAAALGLKAEISCDDRYTDYYYQKEEYCTLTGRRQKSLRGDVNALLKQLPDIRMECYRPEYGPVCLKLFDEWCTGRSCADCFYGCERKAMERFLELYREPECFGALAVSGDRALSFLFGEILPGGVYDIKFQKNVLRQRGLTYWLSRELMLRQPECSWIDLEEDMGIPGIRLDKQRLHPQAMKKKYTVVLQP